MPPLTAFSLLLLLSACSNDPSSPTPLPPAFAIVFPTQQAYDRDGDGLVDLEIRAIEGGPSLDLDTVEVATSRALGPRGEGGTDLLASFQVIEGGPDRLVLEETTDALLPDGEVVLSVRSTDSGTEFGPATVTIELPAGAFHRILDVPELNLSPIGIEMLPDGSRGFFLPFNLEVIPFDPHALTVGDPVFNGGVRDPVDGVFDPVTGKLFLASITEGRIAVIDPMTLAAETPFRVAARGTGIERGPSGLLYSALSTALASISVIDPTARQEVGVVQTDIANELNPQEPAFITEPLFVGGDESRLFVPMGVPPGGLLVVENPSGELEKAIDLDPSPATRGSPLDGLVVDERNAMYLADRGALVEVDLQTETTHRRIETESRVKFLSLSPSRNRLFATTGRFPGPSESWIVDLESFEVVARFLVDVVAGENASVFRPDGQLVFAVRDRDIAVYLNRE